MLMRITAIWLLTVGGAVSASDEVSDPSVASSPKPAAAPKPKARLEAVAAPQTPAAQRNRLSQDAVAELVAQLDSAEYAARESAARTLAEAGATAVPMLKKAAQNGTLEMNIRAVAILETIYTNLDAEETNVDAAESALEALATSKTGSAADRARAVLARNSDIRQRRAIAAIERLGGSVQFRDDRPGRPPTDERPISHVVIGRAWKGGNEGLKYIQRLQEVPAVYVIRGADVSEEALQELQQTIPNLELQHRGAAYLGVSGWPLQDGKGCQIRDVVAGAAAEKAGLRPGDIIIGFDGKPVPDFDTLIELIGQCSPEQKVTVKILRPGAGEMQPMELQVVMGRWTPR